MDFRISVDFRSRGLQDARPYALGQTQHIDCTMDAGLGGLNRVVLVMNGRSRTGKVVNSVNLDIERKSNVVPD
jgi:hypothetical protein